MQFYVNGYLQTAHDIMRSKNEEKNQTKAIKRRKPNKPPASPPRKYHTHVHGLYNLRET